MASWGCWLGGYLHLWLFLQLRVLWTFPTSSLSAVAPALSRSSSPQPGLGASKSALDRLHKKQHEQALVKMRQERERERLRVTKEKSDTRKVLIETRHRLNVSCPPSQYSRDSVFFEEDTSSTNKRKCVWRKNMTTTRDNSLLASKYAHEKVWWDHSRLITKNIEVSCNGSSDSRSYLTRTLRYLSAIRDCNIDTIAFFGDSVMMQQYDMMSITMKSLKLKSTETVQVHYIEAKGVDLTDTIGHVKKLFEAARGKTAAVVANFGLHYQHNFLTSGKKALLRAVGHLLDEWEILSEVKRPMLLWREGTPIQHPYPNGWWEPSYQHCSPKVCCDCVTLTDTMKRGNISEVDVNARSWDIFPSQAMDKLVATMLEQHNVSVVKVYNALASRADLHAGRNNPDCTHFGSDALLYLNEQVLKAIVSNCG